MIDAVQVAQNAMMLIALMAALWLIMRFGRLILGVSFVILFCFGHFGWAFFAFWLLGIAEGAQRQSMAELRAAGLCNGPWIP